MPCGSGAPLISGISKGTFFSPRSAFPHGSGMGGGSVRSTSRGGNGGIFLGGFFLPSLSLRIAMMANKTMTHMDESILISPLSILLAAHLYAARRPHFTGCVGRILSSVPAVLMALRISVSACTLLRV